MPTVPRLQTQINQAGVPNARFSTQSNGEMFGGGRTQQEMGQAVNKLAGVSQKIMLEELEKADQVKINEAVNRLGQAETDMLYHPANGLMNKQGQDSFDAPNLAKQKYNEIKAEIEKGLSSHNQRDRFNQILGERQVDTDRQLQRHVSNEFQKYDNQLTQSLVATERDAAIKNFNDPDFIGRSIQKQAQAIQEYAGRIGASDEFIALKTKEAESQTHSGVVNRLVSGGQDLKAKEYYQSIKDRLSGEDEKKLEGILREGSLRGESQRQTDSIVGQYSSRAEALKVAKKIEEPELRDMVESRINKHFGEQEALKNEHQEKLYTDYSKLLDESPGKGVREIIPPDVWTSLEPKTREALDKRANNPYNDNKAWLDFIDKDPTQLASMNRAQFETEYWTKFDSAHRGRAESMWLASQKAKGGSGGSGLHLTQALSYKDQIDNALRMSGVIDQNKKRSSFTDKDVEAFTRFETEAARRLEEFEIQELGGKRKATGQERQKLIDDMVKQKVKVKGWFSDSEVPIAALTEKDVEDAVIPFDQIEPEHKTEIINMLKSSNKAYDTAMVEKAYLAYKRKDYRALKSIVGE